MLKASRNLRTGFRADFTYQVTDFGDEIATINETRLTINLGGHSFSVHRKGILGPEYQLKSGDTIIATASQDARDTLEFTEALIEYVFTYRDKFEEFKKRRAKATSPPKEAPAEKQKASGQ